MRRGARVAGILLVSALLGYLASEWLSHRRAPAPAPQAPAAAAAPDTAPAGAEPRTVAASPYGDLRVEPGATLEIPAAQLEPGRPVVLHLVLGEPSRSDEPRPVRILAFDGKRQLEEQGTLAADRKDARIEIDPTFLTPGRYLVEVRTTEMSHLPLRRYVLEVR